MNFFNISLLFLRDIFLKLLVHIKGVISEALDNTKLKKTKKIIKKTIYDTTKTFYRCYQNSN